ncbi:MAG: hypothetical protein BAJATHORv1_20007 [Candidatus Thorarchaeota archaeon]|nr:MAG: hypothetical protein BAJATHORv1_20007 [Candidatus Thorarchaeota archaeon]
MGDADSSGIKVDVVLVIIAFTSLTASIWTWLIAMPIVRPDIVLATSIAVISALVLVLLAAILILLRVQRRISHLETTIASVSADPTPSESVIIVTLSNTERRILNQLEDIGGMLAQDELRRVTGLSRSTLSVALSSLERKSLVTRESQGRTKIVTLEHRVKK